MSTAVLEVKGGLGGDAGYRVGEVSGTVGLWGGTPLPLSCVNDSTLLRPPAVAA